MSSQYSQALEDISTALEACESWTATQVIVEVTTSLTNDVPVQVDLMETLKCKGKKSCRTKLHNVYWLPQSFSTNTKEFRDMHLVPYFARACQAAGFSVISKGWEHTRLLTRFICQRGRRAKDSNTDASIATGSNDTKPSHHRSQRPFAGQHKICPFNFTVHWSPDKQRWYLPKIANGNPNHEGHLQRAPEIVRVLMKNAPINEREIAQDILSQFGACTTTVAVLRKRTGLSVSKDQIKYLSSKLREVTKAAQLSAIAEDARPINPDLVRTPADKLLLSLDSDPTKSYVALYGVHNSNLVTIRQRSKLKSVGCSHLA